MCNKIIFLKFIIIFSLIGCNNCAKLRLVESEKEWIINYFPGQIYSYKNKLSGKIDTLQVLDTSNSFTPCNKVELSKYQFETYVVRLIFKSRNNYNRKSSLITLTKFKTSLVEPEIIVAGLGTIENSYQRPTFILTDTIIDGKKYEASTVLLKGKNAEVYGSEQYLKSFCWDKKFGLISYTTINDEVFVRIN